MADPTLEELLRRCERRAVHLELRDGYMRDDPMFVAWQQGHREDPADRNSWWRPWLSLIQETTARGVEVCRGRVISEPVSDYVRFEYDVTFTNVAAGEQVRWLPRRRATDLALSGNDFWLMDDTVVMVNHFDGDGQFTGEEVVVEPALIKLCASAFEAVWERAIPHEAYRPA
ncbi:MULTISPECIES: DUF6879 family protein [Streptomyces]|uniref:DUF6879 family protein n=1 Tax=Streptomyces TaxID=1883 RepID=UPI0024A2AA2D|nr:DUF6879 family protein [Streptomyces sp. NBRC 13847]GLW16524.1 hypothetical protein Stsp01_32670 [Streptomyces sp. NBRC 13847]